MLRGFEVKISRYDWDTLWIMLSIVVSLYVIGFGAIQFITWIAGV
jgi:hypothetical protein